MGAERYQRVWDPEQRKHLRVHRLVAEQTHGRALKPGEVVHHRDGDRTNNKPDNLRILPSQRHHMALEHIERKRKKGQEPLFDDDTFLA